MSDEQVVDNLWDEETKLGENLILNESQGLQAASLNQLIIFLTDGEEPQQQQQQQQQLWDDMILTHPTFTTSKKLFQKMIQRYNVPKQVVNKEGDFNKEWRSTVQSRVLRFLLRWMESEPRDFLKDEMFKELSELTKTFQSDGWDVLTEEILSILQKEIEPLLLQTESDIPRTLPPEIDVNKLLLSLDETTFARQLTLYDARIFQRIPKREFIDQGWNRKSHSHQCPNLLKWISDFNFLPSWVSSVIVSEESLERRVEIYCKIVRIAFACFRLHNFSGTMKLISGLHNAVVYRLKCTREAAPNEIKGMWEEMTEVLSPNHTYMTYRDLLCTIKPPGIPYLGVFLTDLVFIGDGYPDLHLEQINIQKKRLICQVIRKFDWFQGLSFPFEEDPIIQGCFGNLNRETFDETQLFRLSVQREPRRERKK